MLTSKERRIAAAAARKWPKGTDRDAWALRDGLPLGAMQVDCINFKRDQL